MELSIMEEAVVFSALKRYRDFCKSCLLNPDNKDQEFFIRSDLDIAEDLIQRLESDSKARSKGISLL